MGAKQSNIIEEEVPSEKVQTPKPKIPRLYMSMVRKRTLTVSVYDYPEHLNPFREEEEVERRAALAALEGRTSRCHLLPMSPYATVGRSPKSKIDLSPTSSGSSTPDNTQNEDEENQKIDIEENYRKRLKSRRPLSVNNLCMVRKRTLTVSVYDYPEHLNPFREEEEVERRAALAALEGRTSRCHLLPMSPYATVGRSPKSKIDLSPTSSGSSTPVNGTLRRRMKRRAPLPPGGLTAVTPNSTPIIPRHEAASPAPTERSRPATPSSATSTPEATSPTHVAAPPPPSDDHIKSSCSQESSTLSCSVSKEKDPATEAQQPDDCVEMAREEENKSITDTATTLPREHDPPAEENSPETAANMEIKTQEEKEEIERLNTEMPDEQVINNKEILSCEIINLDVENNNSNNKSSLLEQNESEKNEIESKSELKTKESENITNDDDETSRDLAPSPVPRRSKSPMNSVENTLILKEEVENEDIIIVKKSRSNDDTDEAFQDDTIEDNNIKNSDKDENILEKSITSPDDTLPYIDQDPTSNNISNEEENKIISNGHCTDDEVTPNGHDKEVLDKPQTSHDLAPSPVPIRSKSPMNSAENSPTKNSAKSSQDKYTTQVSHFEIKITDITDV